MCVQSFALSELQILGVRKGCRFNLPSSFSFLAQIGFCVVKVLGTNDGPLSSIKTFDASTHNHIYTEIVGQIDFSFDSLTHNNIYKELVEQINYSFDATTNNHNT